MANDESVLREVEQGLAEDRQMDFIRKQGPYLAAAAAAVVLTVGGWQFWTDQSRRAAEKSAVAFREAVETLAENPEAGRAELEAFGATAPGGYKVLSDLRRASSLSAGGERIAALETYRGVYADGAAPKRLQQLARLRAAFLALEDGRDAVISDLGELENDPSVFGFYAREIAGVAALDASDFETAQSIFERLSLAPEAPDALRQRAEEFSALASAGKAGAALTTEVQLQDLSTALSKEDAAAFDNASDVDTADEATAGDEQVGDENSEPGEVEAVEAAETEASAEPAAETVVPPAADEGETDDTGANEEPESSE